MRNGGVLRALVALWACIVLSARLVLAELCQRDAGVYQKILQKQRLDFIRDGEPAKSEVLLDPAYAKLGEACATWKSSASCCQDNFFQAAQKVWNRQLRSFAGVVDAYKGLETEYFEPAYLAMMATDGRQPDDKPANEGKQAKKEIKAAAAIVKNFIEGCEDQIRRFFTVTECQLCDPTFASKTVEDVPAYNSQNVRVLYEACKNVPDDLKRAAKMLLDASCRLKILSGSSHQAKDLLTRAADRVARAAEVVELASRHTGIYAEEDVFMKKFKEAGHVYKPVTWGRIDSLHPSKSVARAVEDKKTNKQCPRASKEGSATAGQGSRQRMRHERRALRNR